MLFIAVVALYSLTAHSVYGDASDEDVSELSIDLYNLHRLETADVPPLHILRRPCIINLHSHHCAFLDMNDLKEAEIFLKSGDSPGKRDSHMSDDGSEDDVLQSDEIGSFELSQGVDEYKQAISTLGQLLRKSKPVIENIPTQKRGCRVRLGGHCLTESLDRAANQYYYLKSPNSPGRRRRGVSSSNQRQAKQYSKLTSCVDI